MLACVRNGSSRSCNVVDFVASRNRVCDFLLIINSKRGPILPRFRDIAGFLRKATLPLFRPNFRRVPLGWDGRWYSSEERRPKLITRNWFRTSSTCTPTVPQRYGRTDRQTVNITRTTYDSNTALALRASSGNKTLKHFYNIFPNVLFYM